MDDFYCPVCRHVFSSASQPRECTLVSPCLVRPAAASQCDRHTDHQEPVIDAARASKPTLDWMAGVIPAKDPIAD